MYQFLDRSAAELAPVDQLLLHAMRQWVATIRAGRCPCSVLGPVLRGRGLVEMLPDLNMAMLLIERENLSQLRFKPPFSAEIGDDEALLLSLHALARAGAQPRVDAVIEQIVKPEARLPLSVAVARIAVAFAR
ncbi:MULTISPECIES: hypothetical protein [Sphingomonas]|uniref:Uncharacterized protein n=1 Tax=Sphingomonas kyeonggiensis TaxID=1268553 RepID=A0A7W7NTR2_9SPHN|nr:MULTISPECIES: hypothetical protein [Sphingomonas]MBB4841173.1 hypothetical protein [Sphingomonas kyeonggiensis]WHU02607.1 hypothetical protein O3305_20900 [Sphingomonas sp. NIBR02145]